MQFSYISQCGIIHRDDSRLHLPPLLPPSMMVDPATVGLVVANFLAWGHWPICAKLGSENSNKGVNEERVDSRKADQPRRSVPREE